MRVPAGALGSAAWGWLVSMCGWGTPTGTSRCMMSVLLSCCTALATKVSLSSGSPFPLLPCFFASFKGPWRSTQMTKTLSSDFCLYACSGIRCFSQEAKELTLGLSSFSRKHHQSCTCRAHPGGGGRLRKSKPIGALQTFQIQSIAHQIGPAVEHHGLHARSLLCSKRSFLSRFSITAFPHGAIQS